MRPYPMFAIGIGVVTLVGVGFWYFAYGLSPTIPERARIDSLEAPASVTVHSDGVVTVSAGSASDLYRALGFAQGSNRTWAALLLRQTAIGQLSRWFGSPAVDIDGHVAQLRLEELARLAYLALDAEDQRRLQAFADGMTAGMSPGFVTRLDPLVALRVTPEPWEPWHTLAVERLFAWLSAEVPIEAASSDNLKRFAESKRTLHDQFALGGFDRSAGWAFRRDDITYVHYRFVHGRSALPFFLDVALETPASRVTAGLALAGTPFLIAGKTEQRVWLLVPRSTVTEGASTEETAIRGARITVNPNLAFVTSDNDARPVEFHEHVVSYTVDNGGALVFGDSPQDSSALRLHWSGFEPVSDAAAFGALLVDQTPRFQLQDGVILTVSRTGLWTSEAGPEWNSRFAGGILVEQSPWTRYHVERLDELIRQGDSLSTAGWSADTYSPWAESIVPPLLAAVGADANQSLQYESAVTYLRNWDYHFAPSSIAGSILDTWAAEYHRRSGTLATAETITADSSFTHTARASLHVAVEELNRRLGPDLSAWRWEQSQATLRPYPFWSLFSGPTAWVTKARFSSASPLGVGHPSTLAWGATSERSGDPPGAWNIVVQTDQWDDWWIQRNHPASHRVMTFQDAIADFDASTGKVPSAAEALTTTRLVPGR